jgi:hypothetical protein
VVEIVKLELEGVIFSKSKSESFIVLVNFNANSRLRLLVVFWDAVLQRFNF